MEDSEGAMADDALAKLLLRLDRLEELREDMLELGVTTLTELEAEIQQLEQQIDDAPDDTDGPV
jgi:hypothetical protein